jgi:hypothetical protein
MVAVLSVSSMFGSCGNRGEISAREVRKEAEAFDMEGMADKVMTAIKNKDVEALKSMMSPNILKGMDDLDSKIEQLMDFPKVNIEDYQYYENGDEWAKRDGQYRIRRSARMDFRTDEGEYRISIDCEVVNTYLPEDKGICLVSVHNLNTDEGIVVQSKTEKFYVGD